MKPTKGQFDDHSCPGCPDTSEFENVEKQGGLFSGWAKAAKEHAIASHKFDLAADNYLKNR